MKHVGQYTEGITVMKFETFLLLVKFFNFFYYFSPFTI